MLWQSYSFQKNEEKNPNLLTAVIHWNDDLYARSFYNAADSLECYKGK